MIYNFLKYLIFSSYNLTIDSNVGTITNDIKPANDIATIVNDSIKWTPFDIGKNINENTTIDGYFYGWVKNGSIGWYYDSACTIPYNADVDTINEYLVKIYEEDTTQTLVLYGKILKKHSVYREEVHHTNTNTVLKKQSFVGWYSPGQSYTLPVASDFTNRTTDDTPYYLMYIYVNGASNSSDSIEITGNTVVSARYLRIVTVTIEGPGKKAGFWNYDLPIIVCSGFHGESTTNLNYASENNTANYSATGNTDTTLYVVEGAIIEVNNDKLDIAWGKSVSISNCTNNGDGTYTVGISDVTVKAE